MKPMLLLGGLFTLFLLGACKSKKKTLTGDEPVAIEEFIDFFDEVKLPLQLADTSLVKPMNDSLLISQKIFNQFVADTVITRQFCKNAKPKIYPAGKATVKNAETYLFIKAFTPGKKIAYVLAFDKEKKFVSSLPLIVADKDIITTQLAAMDSRYTISTNLQRKTPDAQMLYKKNAYVFNSEGAFTLILTESNDVAAIKNVLINPLDTLPRKNKWSGDYIQDKNNLVSFRDGKTSNDYLVFVHFEKEKGTCKGELKGKAKMAGTAKAVFAEQGDPCLLEFNFKPGSVTLKEEGACGSHRDIKCFFEGSFIRKKDPKPVKAAKRK